jgi:MFS family permease
MITRTVRILSLVSLLNDMASELLYPVMPVFLRSIGFSIIMIGILEGLAEAIAGVSKSYFGKMSDNMGKRLPFVQLGYAMSAISKPLMAVFVYPLGIFFARTMDRIGKGVRTGARDALLSDECSPENKGKVFGFHRSMDTIGAVVGPLAGLIYLYFYPSNYKELFLLAFLPGLAAVLLTFMIKERKKERPLIKKRANFFAFVGYWKTAKPEYRSLVIGLLVFALFNSSDVFLLLKMKESGMDDVAVIGVYIFYNLVYALLAWPVGVLADKIGLKKVFVFGLAVFAVVYTGFAYNDDNLILFFILFALYGLYAAATEGVSKAWISKIADKTETATALGSYSGLQSICTLIASSTTGFLWWHFGPMVTFIVTAVVTLIVVVYMLLRVR